MENGNFGKILLRIIILVQRISKVSYMDGHRVCVKYRDTMKTMKTYMSKNTFLKIAPNESLKRAYGILKKTKPGEPVRPIVSSVNSVTSGAEEYLLNIIKPIIDKCSYSVNSTKSFKAKFLEIRDKFDMKKYECVSFDAKSLFTSVNVEKTVNYICDIIYKNPKNYLQEYNNDPNDPSIKIPLPIPPRNIFQTFFKDILLKFSEWILYTGPRPINGV